MYRFSEPRAGLPAPPARSAKSSSRRGRRALQLQLQSAMAEERPPAPSEESMPKKGKAEYSQARTLIDDVLSQWTWIKDLNSNLAAMVPLRDYVTTYREAAWRVGTNLRVSLTDLEEPLE
eukprot:scaffold42356_cov34-Tisochrysis_lutea.AAC.1